jgi:hypothetical protein
MARQADIGEHMVLEQGKAVQGPAAPQIASQPADDSEGPSGVPMFSFVQSVFTHGGDPFRWVPGAALRAGHVGDCRGTIMSFYPAPPLHWLRAMPILAGQCIGQ